MPKLQCVIVGDGRVFSVNMELNMTVEDLKKAIFHANSDLAVVNVALLKLHRHRATRGDAWLKHDNEEIRAIPQKEIPESIKALLVDPMEECLPLNLAVNLGKDFVSHHGDYHVLVELPNTVALRNPKKHPRIEFEECSRLGDWFGALGTSFSSCDELPPMETLDEFVTMPLPAKLGLAVVDYDHLKDKIGDKLCDALCYVEEHRPSRDNWENLLVRVLDFSSERGHRGFGDAAISRLLKAVWSEANLMCSDVGTSRGSSRPTGYSLQNRRSLCLRSPRKVYLWRFELAKTRTERHIGVGVGREDAVHIRLCRFWASLRTVRDPLARSDDGLYKRARCVQHRALEWTVQLMLALLQLSRLFPGIVHRCPDAARKEFLDIDRLNCVAIHLYPTCVVKDYTDACSRIGIEDLTKRCVRLKSFCIRNMEHLTYVSTCGPRVESEASIQGFVDGRYTPA